eukprot:CAMPEP_0119162556 /NCGR_PEP_ID=MMETSP1315-20130426/2547_1 /TAXON_ID=676789 /ORGANISM="Prasinoderma singularis, Strain RCC927" /LENGTH=144 /DNA_ID=CAMNT_0007155437 /DNA_START=37 /DNA_END=468 /DNA_ORIENTATION=-
MAAQKQVAQAKPGVSVVADASRGVARAAGIIARVARRDDEWERTDFLEAVYWTRQLLGLTLALAFGLLGLQGGYVAIAGAAAVYVSPMAMYSGWLDVDVADVVGGDQAETIVLQEGNVQGVGLFFLVWIVTHTLRLSALAAAAG